MVIGSEENTPKFSFQTCFSAVLQAVKLMVKFARQYKDFVGLSNNIFYKISYLPFVYSEIRNNYRVLSAFCHPPVNSQHLKS